MSGKAIAEIADSQRALFEAESGASNIIGDVMAAIAAGIKNSPSKMLRIIVAVFNN